MKTPHPCSLERLEDRIAPSTLIVTTLKDTTDAANDTGSLRDAILEANATAGADTIIFQTTVHAKTVPLHGTIKLTSDLPIISDSLTINGPVPGKASSLVLNGNNHSVISINNGDLNLTDLTITQGKNSHGGGVYISGGTSALNDVTISGNHATSVMDHTRGSMPIPAAGGGIDIASGNVTITASRITGNVAMSRNQSSAYPFVPLPASGGGINIASGTVTITDSKITGNAAKGYSEFGSPGGPAMGGGIFCGGTLVVQGSVVSGNIAQGGMATRTQVRMAGRARAAGSIPRAISRSRTQRSPAIRYSAVPERPARRVTTPTTATSRDRTATSAETAVPLMAAGFMPTQGRPSSRDRPFPAILPPPANRHRGARVVPVPSVPLTMVDGEATEAIRRAVVYQVTGEHDDPGFDHFREHDSGDPGFGGRPARSTWDARCRWYAGPRRGRRNLFRGDSRCLRRDAEQKWDGDGRWRFHPFRNGQHRE